MCPVHMQDDSPIPVCSVTWEFQATVTQDTTYDCDDDDINMTWYRPHITAGDPLR